MPNRRTRRHSGRKNRRQTRWWERLGEVTGPARLVLLIYEILRDHVL
jgi:hypothetical protein